MKCKNIHLFLFIFLFLPAISVAQFFPTPPLPVEIGRAIGQDSSVTFRVSGISIIGNKKTKAYIIRRELLFKEGDTIGGRRLYDIIHQSRSLVYNTSLFTLVDIFPEFQDSTDLHFTVTVREKWYVYPTPQFQLADRNFNEWINTHNADFNRVIYGAKFTHYNLSGRRDKLDIYLLNGYARNLSFNYSAPYSNRSLTEGFSASVSYTQNREISYKTTPDNKLAFVKAGKFVRENFSVAGTYIKRTGYYWRQTFGVGYTFNNVADTILTSSYNPNYFNSNKAYQNFADINYTLQYINVDNNAYPLSGKAGKIGVRKRGFDFAGGVNALTFDGFYVKYNDHGKGWFTSLALMSQIALPFKLAYINQRAFGFGDYYLRGLENYVIDGPASALTRFTLKKHLATFKIPLPFKSNVLPYIPFSFYGKIYGDAGYAYQRKEFDTRLNNKFLYTGGFGLDVLTLYDLNFRIE
ncbi:MAG: hypothetical protein EOO01_15095, partial [Chitinophagaceae bacterium]